MKSLARVRYRAKRCYELTGLAMIKKDGADQFTLVHGQIHNFIQHAWIETDDGRVYDPATHEYYPLAEFYAKPAVAERRYTRQQAAVQMSANRHYGPWHGAWHDHEEARRSKTV